MLIIFDNREGLILVITFLVVWIMPNIQEAVIYICQGFGVLN